MNQEGNNPEETSQKLNIGLVGTKEYQTQVKRVAVIKEAAVEIIFDDGIMLIFNT